MDTELILVAFLSSFLVAVTTYSIFSAFGPNAKSLTDPFEDHED